MLLNLIKCDDMTRWIREIIFQIKIHIVTSIQCGIISIEACHKFVRASTIRKSTQKLPTSCDSLHRNEVRLHLNTVANNQIHSFQAHIENGNKNSESSWNPSSMIYFVCYIFTTSRRMIDSSVCVQYDCTKFTFESMFPDLQHLSSNTMCSKNVHIPLKHSQRLSLSLSHSQQPR